MELTTPRETREAIYDQRIVPLLEQIRHFATEYGICLHVTCRMDGGAAARKMATSRYTSTSDVGGVHVRREHFAVLEDV